ncbi:HYR domain-containing protein, partial [Lentimicrobium sp. L6]|uniref:HYR domain-containing protein n=1 Tax=Lentimicrobium sp. L6 TaxID=2735916 RepID=UPI00155407BF
MGNTATCTVNQTVIDNTAPTITVCASTPSNIPANGSCTASAPNLTGSVTASDNCTSSPTITQSPAAGATLGLGTTTITLTATDGSGNTATCTVNQTVIDNTAPTITVCASTPSNIPANGSCTASAPNLTGSVTATDNCTSSPTITQSPAAGATLGLGTTTITLTATDGSGNTATCTVNQTVIDNTAPTITVCASTPSNIPANG